MDNEIIENAKKHAQKWLDAFSLDGNPNTDKILEVLSNRTFKGEKVEAYVAKSPEEAIEILTKCAEGKDNDVKEVIRNAYSCIWDYYLMAFYESSCAQLPNKDFEGAEFIYQSLLPAFEAGLGYLINLGPLIVGVCLPEAYRDDQFRIHKENGPAIIWGNDEEYWWHGTKVEKDWIENPDKVDPNLCITHENVEQRRALCEIIGWDKVLSKLDVETVSTDEFGELLKVNLPDAPNELFVRVRCGTGRAFCLPVPPEMTTAHQAVAWTYNLDVTADYKPEVRT